MIDIELETKKAAMNLKMAFSGRGIVGLREILKQGNVLSPIANEAGRILHNDRCAMIEMLVGPGNMDLLIDGLCSIITKLQGEPEETDLSHRDGETPQEKRREEYEKPKEERAL